MTQTNLLDCTLRDGAYVIDKNFGNNTIKGIVRGLTAAKLDIVEIGFLEDSGYEERKVVFSNSLEAKKMLPVQHENTIYSAFADYSRYSPELLDDCTGDSFTLVRACFFKNERRGAMDFCRKIQKKGYLLSVQPVDILGYTDYEILQLIEDVNILNPYCFSIVDTFGSMYEEDLTRIYRLVHHNLLSSCMLGFHSHNNLQMSFALCQAFIKMSTGERNTIVDTTALGIGRGAGNAPTELVARYMVGKLKASYDVSEILDVIDNYITPLKRIAQWGYDIPLYLAGTFNAHVNNVSYLKEKSSIRSKDIGEILLKIPLDERKRYDYERLEQAYLEHSLSTFDDTKDFNLLRKKLSGKIIVLVAPGHSSYEEREKILEFIQLNQAIVIAINFIPSAYPVDYVYVSNVKRFYMNKDIIQQSNAQKIFCSNVMHLSETNSHIISLNRLLVLGWRNIDNSAILLLRLLAQLNIKQVGMVGLDGYSQSETSNYYDREMEIFLTQEKIESTNKELSKMLRHFVENNPDVEVTFVTKSRFEECIP